MYIQVPLLRREEIAVRLARGQAVEASALAQEFKISEDAIRRDLRTLAAEGKCRRVYGGALPPLKDERPLPAKIVQAVTQTRELAAAAAATVLPGELLFLDAGNSNLAIVDFLRGNSSLTVATNSIDIASMVLNRGDIPLILIGGRVNAVTGACFDVAAFETVEKMNIDRCFINADAVSSQDGLSVYDHSDAAFKRAVLRRSGVRIALASLEALDRRAPYRIAKGDEIDCLIVEKRVSAFVADALTTAGFILIKT
ncbi:DeoR/GlpR family DNA-binding transcription regulator [Pararhizobium sp. DWP1-1-3]|uniref:DeoR/GlpR family DNA-binding transcription regulator n=1 Tax=Pararhizobium sp. DWP1-1-3 TaxID=2804652 RepID=UPI003CF5ED8B